VNPNHFAPSADFTCSQRQLFRDSNVDNDKPIDATVKWGNFEHLSNFKVILKLFPIFFSQFFLTEGPNEKL